MLTLFYHHTFLSLLFIKINSLLKLLELYNHDARKEWLEASEHQLRSSCSFW